MSRKTKHICARSGCTETARDDRKEFKNWRPVNRDSYLPDDWILQKSNDGVDDYICYRCYQTKLRMQTELQERRHTRNGLAIPEPARPYSKREAESSHLENLYITQPTQLAADAIADVYASSSRASPRDIIDEGVGEEGEGEGNFKGNSSG